MKVLVLALSLVSSILVYAQDPIQEQEPNPQCLERAIEIAKSLDKVNGSRFAKEDVTSVPTQKFSIASALTEENITFNFGNGRNLLEVVYKPNYHKPGDCVFESAVVIQQEE